MKTKKILAVILIISLLVSVAGIEGFNCYAETGTATASITVSGNTTVGSTISVNCTYSGAKFGCVDGVLEFSSNLEYVGCTSGHQVGVGAGSIKITLSSTEQVKSMTCTLNFKVKKSGSASLTLRTTSAYNFDENMLSCNTASKSFSIKDNTPTVSSNADLSSLRVSEGYLSPSFSPSVTSYTVKVGNGVTKCTVSAVAADSKSDVSISSNHSLSVGDNVRTVVVTAESGKTKKYTVNIIRAKASSGSSSGESEEKPGDDNAGEKENDDDKKTEESTQEDKKIEAEIDGQKYIVTENLVGTELPKGFKLESVKYNEFDIPVAMNESGTVKLANLKKSETESGKWFFYDETKGTFSESVKMSADDLISYGESVSKLNEDTALTDGDKLEEKSDKSDKKFNTIYLVLGLFILIELLIVLFIIIKIKKGKQKIENEEDFENKNE